MFLSLTSPLSLTKINTSMAQTTHKRAANGSLAAGLQYGSLATTFLAATTGANGQVLYTDVNPDLVYDDSGVNIDMDGNGALDILLQQGDATFSSGAVLLEKVLAAAPDAAAENNALMGSVTGGYVYPAVVAAGAQIGPAVTSFVSFAANSSHSIASVFQVGTNTYPYGGWHGESGFLGLRFKAGANTHYGWIEIEVAQDATSFILKGFAFQATPNTAITAGDIATVGVSELQKPITLSAQPNPALDMTNIRFNADAGGDADLVVLNTTGQQVHAERQPVAPGANSLRLDMSKLAPGNYVVEIRTETQVGRQVVQRVR
jgi:Secretion system C-terminal sorting domain